MSLYGLQDAAYTRILQKVLLYTKYMKIGIVYQHLVYSNLLRNVSWTKAQFNKSRDYLIAVELSPLKPV